MKTTYLQLLCVALLLAACKKEAATPEKRITGEWHTLSYRHLFSSSTLWQNFSGIRITFGFKPNQVFTVDGEAPVRPDGKWKLTKHMDDFYNLEVTTGDTLHQYHARFSHNDTLELWPVKQTIVNQLAILRLVRK